MRFRFFLSFAVLLLACQAACADTITAKLGGVSGAGNQTFGTFTFVIPAGATVTSAVLTLNGVYQTFLNGENIFLNDDYLGQTGFSDPTATDMNFTVTNLAKLLSGSATLRDTESYVAGASFFSTSGETLTITTSGGAAAATPEPSSLVLLSTGVLGVLATLRKRSI